MLIESKLLDILRKYAHEHTLVQVDFWYKGSRKNYPEAAVIEKWNVSNCALMHELERFVSREVREELAKIQDKYKLRLPIKDHLQTSADESVPMSLELEQFLFEHGNDLFGYSQLMRKPTESLVQSVQLTSQGIEIEVDTKISQRLGPIVERPAATPSVDQVLIDTMFLWYLQNSPPLVPATSHYGRLTDAEAKEARNRLDGQLQVEGIFDSIVEASRSYTKICVQDRLQILKLFNEAKSSLVLEITEQEKNSDITDLNIEVIFDNSSFFKATKNRNLLPGFIQDFKTQYHENIKTKESKETCYDIFIKTLRNTHLIKSHPADSAAKQDQKVFLLSNIVCILDEEIKKSIDMGMALAFEKANSLSSILYEAERDDKINSFLNESKKYCDSKQSHLPGLEIDCIFRSPNTVHYQFQFKGDIPESHFLEDAIFKKYFIFKELMNHMLMYVTPVDASKLRDCIQISIDGRRWSLTLGPEQIISLMWAMKIETPQQDMIVGDIFALNIEEINEIRDALFISLVKTNDWRAPRRVVPDPFSEKTQISVKEAQESQEYIENLRSIERSIIRFASKRMNLASLDGVMAFECYQNSASSSSSSSDPIAGVRISIPLPHVENWRSKQDEHYQTLFCISLYKLKENVSEEKTTPGCVDFVFNICSDTMLQLLLSAKGDVDGYITEENFVDYYNYLSMVKENDGETYPAIPKANGEPLGYSELMQSTKANDFLDTAIQATSKVAGACIYQDLSMVARLKSLEERLLEKRDAIISQLSATAFKANTDAHSICFKRYGMLPLRVCYERLETLSIIDLLQIRDKIFNYKHKLDCLAKHKDEILFVEMDQTEEDRGSRISLWIAKNINSRVLMLENQIRVDAREEKKAKEKMEVQKMIFGKIWPNIDYDSLDVSSAWIGFLDEPQHERLRYQKTFAMLNNINKEVGNFYAKKIKERFLKKFGAEVRSSSVGDLQASALDAYSNANPSVSNHGFSCIGPKSVMSYILSMMNNAGYTPVNVDNDAQTKLYIYTPTALVRFLYILDYSKEEIRTIVMALFSYRPALELSECDEIRALQLQNMHALDSFDAWYQNALEQVEVEGVNVDITNLLRNTNDNEIELPLSQELKHLTQLLVRKSSGLLRTTTVRVMSGSIFVSFSDITAANKFFYSADCLSGRNITNPCNFSRCDIPVLFRALGLISDDFGKILVGLNIDPETCGIEKPTTLAKKSFSEASSVTTTGKKASGGNEFAKKKTASATSIMQPRGSNAFARGAAPSVSVSARLTAVLGAAPADQLSHNAQPPAAYFPKSFSVMSSTVSSVSTVAASSRPVQEGVSASSPTGAAHNHDSSFGRPKQPGEP